MSTQTIKAGDIVRLTDPISHGQVVRIESVGKNGCASWLGGAQYSDFEQILCEFEAQGIENGLHGYYQTLSDVISFLEIKIGVKLYPESAVQYWKHRAEKAEAAMRDNRPLTPEILTAAGWDDLVLTKTEKVFEKRLFDPSVKMTSFVKVSLRPLCDKIKINFTDKNASGEIFTKLITIGEFNTLLGIVKLNKFQIK